jgi:hypothetical protein
MTHRYIYGSFRTPPMCLGSWLGVAARLGYWLLARGIALRAGPPYR